MSYLVKSFNAKVSNIGSDIDAANQLQELINSQNENGWIFVSVENINTVISGDKGCFGLGGSPPQITNYQMVIFKK